MAKDFGALFMIATSTMLATVAVFASTIGITEPSSNIPQKAGDLMGINAIPHAIHQALPQSKSLQSSNKQIGILTTQDFGSQVNLRSQPTTLSRRWGYGLRGDQVTILKVSPGLDDHFQWYFVEFPNSLAQGWIREDLIVVQPSTSIQEEEQPLRLMPTPDQRAVVSPPNLLSEPVNTYAPEDIGYFSSIALGSEFGHLEERIIKWNTDIKIQVHGSPTTSDLEELGNVVDELDELLSHPNNDDINIEVVSGHDANDANVDIHFVPRNEFRQYQPNANPSARGLVVTSASNYQIENAQILITTTHVSQEERSHVIREELTQSLGLLQDNYWYPDSIFYKGLSNTNQFSDIDRTLVKMLYRRDILPGMDDAQIRNVLT